MKNFVCCLTISLTLTMSSQAFGSDSEGSIVNESYGSNLSNRSYHSSIRDMDSEELYARYASSGESLGEFMRELRQEAVLDYIWKRFLEAYQKHGTVKYLHRFAIGTEEDFWGIANIETFERFEELWGLLTLQEKPFIRNNLTSYMNFRITRQIESELGDAIDELEPTKNRILQIIGTL